MANDAEALPAAAESRSSPKVFWLTLGNVILTLVALSFVIATTSGIIYLAVTRIPLDKDTAHVPLSFALVPIFGAIGGIVGAVITKDNRIHLCRFRDSATFELGVVGHAITGLGGAAAVMFVFGITEFSIVPPTPGKMVVLVSITFLSGAFGPAVVQLLGRHFLKRLENLARDAAKSETANLKQDFERVRESLDTRTLVQAAAESIRDGLATEALDFSLRAIAIDPLYPGAYIQKGRALRRLNRLEDALSTLQDLLRFSPAYPSGIYNRACYRLLRGDEPELVFPDLRRAFDLKPELKVNAANDPDLARALPLLYGAGIFTPPVPSNGASEKNATTVPVFESNIL